MSILELWCEMTTRDSSMNGLNAHFIRTRHVFHVLREWLSVPVFQGVCVHHRGTSHGGWYHYLVAGGNYRQPTIMSNAPAQKLPSHTGSTVVRMARVVTNVGSDHGSRKQTNHVITRHRL